MSLRKRGAFLKSPGIRNLFNISTVFQKAGNYIFPPCGIGKNKKILLKFTFFRVKREYECRYLAQKQFPIFDVQSLKITYARFFPTFLYHIFSVPLLKLAIERRRAPAASEKYARE